MSLELLSDDSAQLEAELQDLIDRYGKEKTNKVWQKLRSETADNICLPSRAARNRDAARRRSDIVAAQLDESLISHLNSFGAMTKAHANTAICNLNKLFEDVEVIQKEYSPLPMGQNNPLQCTKETMDLITALSGPEDHILDSLSASFPDAAAIELALAATARHENMLAQMSTILSVRAKAMAAKLGRWHDAMVLDVVDT